jgi:hypothetical protein
MIILEFLVSWLILSAVVWVAVLIIMLWFETLIYITDRELLFFKSDKLGTLISSLVLTVWFTFPLAVVITIAEKFL